MHQDYWPDANFKLQTQAAWQSLKAFHTNPVSVWRNMKMLFRGFLSTIIVQRFKQTLSTLDLFLQISYLTLTLQLNVYGHTIYSLEW